ncbi:Endoplasmic reticulum transmembrane protein 3 [Umbelopsis nana]
MVTEVSLSAQQSLSHTFALTDSFSLYLCLAFLAPLKDCDLWCSDSTTSKALAPPTRQVCFHVAKAIHVLKIVFVFVFVLFIDSINRLQRPGGLEDQSASNHHIGMHSEVAFAARKFYAQRNLYLTGFTLFLSLILSRTHQLLVELSAAEDALRVANGQAPDSDETKTLRAEIAELKKKHLDYDTLKKQAAQQNKEYDRLADEHNALEESSRGAKETRKDL